MDTTTHYLTTGQVANRVGKTVSTVNRWAKEGTLEPAFKVPGVTGPRLYDPADVLAFIQGENNDGSE